MTHTLKLIGLAGGLTWSDTDPASLAKARELFENGQTMGYRGYAFRPGQRVGEPVETFEATAERIIMHPRMAGG